MIERLRNLRFWPRFALYHSVMVVTGLMYVSSTLSWLSLILGSVMLGSAAAATFHNFRPYCFVWSRKKAFGIRLLHGIVTLLTIYLCLWGRFLEYGSLVGDEVSWVERMSGFMLAGVGFIIAGILLGKGRFEPHPAAVAG